MDLKPVSVGTQKSQRDEAAPEQPSPRGAGASASRLVSLPGEMFKRRLLLGADNPDLRPGNAGQAARGRVVRPAEALSQSLDTDRAGRNTGQVEQSAQALPESLEQRVGSVEISVAKEWLLMRVGRSETFEELTGVCHEYQCLATDARFKNNIRHVQNVCLGLSGKTIGLINTIRKETHEHAANVTDHFISCTRAIFLLYKTRWINVDALSGCFDELLRRIADVLPPPSLDNVSEVMVDNVKACFPVELKGGSPIVGDLVSMLLSNWCKFFIRYLSENQWDMTAAEKFPRDAEGRVSGVFRAYAFFSALYSRTDRLYADNKKQIEIESKLVILKSLSTVPVDRWHEAVRSKSTIDNRLHFTLTTRIGETIKKLTQQYNKKFVLYGSAACVAELCETAKVVERVSSTEVLLSHLCFFINDTDFIVKDEGMQEECVSLFCEAGEKIELNYSRSSMSVFLPVADKHEELKICSVVFFRGDCVLWKINVNYVSAKLENHLGLSSVKEESWEPYFYREDKLFVNYRKRIPVDILNPEGLMVMMKLGLSSVDFIRQFKDMVHLLSLCLSEQQAEGAREKSWQKFAAECIARKLI